jgi:predicted RNase H-like HicB family nuclease
MKNYKIVIEKHPDTYIAYPLGCKGVVVGQGDTYEAVLTDINSAIKFHIETFGDDIFQIDPPVLEAFITELKIAV